MRRTTIHNKCPIGVATVAALTLTLCAPAGATDWSGFYLGGHLGGLVGETTFSDPNGETLFGGNATTSGFMAGVQLGYNWLLAPRWVAGLQADASVLSAQGGNTCLQPSVLIIGSNCKSMPQELATLTGRLGFVTEPRGRTLVYGKAGVALLRTELSINPGNAFNPLEGGATLHGAPPLQGDPTSKISNALGWTVGAGVEYALTPAWSLALEYNYLRFSGIGLPTPETISVTTDGGVTHVPASGTSNITQNLHVARIGFNYRWGVAAKASQDDAPSGSAPEVPWAPSWEIDVGTRYWYSSGRFQTANGHNSALVSRLTYAGMEGHSGEIFARIDSPLDIFVKGLVGGGGINKGKMYDEDWGFTGLGSPPTSFAFTDSDVTGSFNYITADIGANILHGPDHKVGLFLGYNRYQTVMDAFGCRQLVQLDSICIPTTPTNVKNITEIDTWHSARVGTSAEVRVGGRFKIGGEVAWLPYVYFDGLDIHRLREPPVYFPVQGTGHGVQAELILSYRATEVLSFGLGGRYWAMWTTNASLSTDITTSYTANTERYGVFVQASYRFK